MTEVTAEAAAALEAEVRPSVWQRFRGTQRRVTGPRGGNPHLGGRRLAPRLALAAALLPRHRGSSRTCIGGAILGNLAVSLQALGIGFGLAPRRRSCARRAYGALQHYQPDSRHLCLWIIRIAFADFRADLLRSIRPLRRHSSCGHIHLFRCSSSSSTPGRAFARSIRD